MNVYTYPQPFCLETNFCTENEMAGLLIELNKLIPSLNDNPGNTASAKNPDGKYLAKRKGTFVNIKQNDPFDKLQNKIMDPGHIQTLVQRNSIFGYLKAEVSSSMLVSLFEDGDEYDYHTDKAVMSITYYLWEGEFEGGEFYLEHSKVPAGHNSLIIFPSCLQHKVSTIRGKGRRWSITMFVNYIADATGPTAIKSFPKFLQDTDFEYVSEVAKKFKWDFSGNSVDGPPKFLYCDLMSEKFFSEYLFNKIPGGPWELKRVYANGQSFGQNGDFHQDDTDPNSFTFILYANKIDMQFMDKWGGQTEFMMNENVNLIYPDPNKGILFPSTILHRGLGPSRFVLDMRVTIAWKLLKKQ
jgi:predicted 2-oxoglutarate/Fe(II)-dependent dioxygenase YbiX